MATSITGESHTTSTASTSLDGKYKPVDTDPNNSRRILPCQSCVTIALTEATVRMSLDLTASPAADACDAKSSTSADRLKISDRNHS